MSPSADPMSWARYVGEVYQDMNGCSYVHRFAYPTYAASKGRKVGLGEQEVTVGKCPKIIWQPPSSHRSCYHFNRCNPLGSLRSNTCSAASIGYSSAIYGTGFSKLQLRLSLLPDLCGVIGVQIRLRKSSLGLPREPIRPRVSSLDCACPSPVHIGLPPRLGDSDGAPAASLPNISGINVPMRHQLYPDIRLNPAGRYV